MPIKQPLNSTGIPSVPLEFHRIDIMHFEEVQHAGFLIALNTEGSVSTSEPHTIPNVGTQSTT